MTTHALAWYLRRAAVIASTLFLASTFAGAEVTLQVLATDPASPAVLGYWEELDLRIAYTSDRPIYVRAQAFSGGQQVTQMTSGSLLYEGGTGEAFFWLAYTGSQHVDSITVFAEDGQTNKRVTQVSVPVDLTWTGQQGGTPRTPADWVVTLRADTKRRTDAAAAAYKNRPEDWWSLILGFAAMWSVPGYFILQILLLWKLRGGWRLAAAAPILPMMAAVTHAIYAFYRGSNIFPIVVIFTAPFAFLYLLGLLAVKRLRNH